MSPPKPLDALIERLRKTATCVYLACDPEPARDIADALLKAADMLGHLAAGATPAAQDTKPLEALERIERICCGDTAGIWDAEKAQVAVDLIRAALVRAVESELDAARYRWLRTRMTFCNTHPGGRPVLYDTSKRLWYHATDDLETDTIDAAIDARAAQTGGEG